MFINVRIGWRKCRIGSEKDFCMRRCCRMKRCRIKYGRRIGFWLIRSDPTSSNPIRGHRRMKSESSDFRGHFLLWIYDNCWYVTINLERWFALSGDYRFPWGEAVVPPHVDRVRPPIRPVLPQGEHNATCRIQNYRITYRYWNRFFGSDHTNCISAYYLSNPWREPDSCASSLITPFYL